MDWSNESYVRVYTRDTGDLLAVGWEGRSVLWELIRKSDQAGVLDHGGDIDIVAEMLRMPHDFVSTGIDRLAKRGVILLQPTSIVIRNKLVAHAATKSDRQRQRESRETRLSLALASGADPATARAAARPDRYAAGSPDVTTEGHESGPNGHGVTERVTPGHAGSQRVTQSRAEQSKTEQSKEASEAPPRRLPPPEAVRVAGLIAEHVARRDPKVRWLQPDKRERTIAKWADSVRLLNQQDERSWAEIDRVWLWASRHSFWAGNILSGGTLREQFDKLVQQMVPPTNGHSNNPHNPRPATGANEDPILNRVRP